MYYLSGDGKSQAKIVVDILHFTKPSHESITESL